MRKYHVIVVRCCEEGKHEKSHEYHEIETNGSSDMVNDLVESALSHVGEILSVNARYTDE